MGIQFVNAGNGSLGIGIEDAEHLPEGCFFFGCPAKSECALPVGLFLWVEAVMGDGPHFIAAIEDAAVQVIGFAVLFLFVAGAGGVGEAAIPEFVMGKFCAIGVEEFYCGFGAAVEEVASD